MELRALTGLEQQRALYIWSQSFERGDRKMEDWKEWEERTPSGRTTYGIFDSSGLQASFLLVDEEIYLGAEVILPMSAVCGVGALPASRGRGYASEGMRYCFERMREAGKPISVLEPFSWEFYGRLGYAWTSPTRKYSVPTRVLRASSETENVRAVTWSDRARAIACYTEFAKRYRGMVARRPEVWDWFFDQSKKEHTYTYVYERDGTIEGYVTYHGGKREETKLEEFIALTPRATRGLLGLLRRHEMQIATFRWDAPADDGLWFVLMHSDVKTTLATRNMARIVDAASAMEALRPASEFELDCTVAILDDAAPWNQRTWRIECASGRVRATPTDASPQLTFDIQTLAQAYLGSPTVPELRSAGRIQVENERAFGQLERLLAGPPAWCNDGF